MDDINAGVVGDCIRRVMESRGWTQKRLAAASGIGQTAISDYVNGRKMPGLKSAARIAGALGVTIDALCEDDGRKPVSRKGSAVSGRAIAQAVYALWRAGVATDFIHLESEPRIEVIEKTIASRYPSDFIKVRQAPQAVGRLIGLLNDYARAKDTYSDPDAYLEQILHSAAQSIEKEMRIERKIGF